MITSAVGKKNKAGQFTKWKWESALNSSQERHLYLGDFEQRPE